MAKSNNSAGGRQKKKRGLSFDEKCDKMATYLACCGTFLSLKELERTALSKCGVISQSVKQVLDTLVAEGRADFEKVGSGAFFFATPPDVEGARYFLARARSALSGSIDAAAQASFAPAIDGPAQLVASMLPAYALWTHQQALAFAAQRNGLAAHEALELRSRTPLSATAAAAAALAATAKSVTLRGRRVRRLDAESAARPGAGAAGDEGDRDGGDATPLATCEQGDPGAPDAAAAAASQAATSKVDALIPAMLAQCDQLRWALGGRPAERDSESDQFDSDESAAERGADDDDSEAEDEFLDFCDVQGEHPSMVAEAVAVDAATRRWSAEADALQAPSAEKRDGDEDENEAIDEHGAVKGEREHQRCSPVSPRRRAELVEVLALQELDVTASRATARLRAAREAAHRGRSCLAETRARADGLAVHFIELRGRVASAAGGDGVAAAEAAAASLRAEADKKRLRDEAVEKFVRLVTALGGAHHPMIADEVRPPAWLVKAVTA